MKQVTINNEFLSLSVLDYGAIIQKLLVKDRNDKPTNVVVGFDNPSDYLSDSYFLGACIGRYAGRLSGGGFRIGDAYYPIHAEDNVHLHGGKEGFGKKYWTIEEVKEGTESEVQLSYKSPDMEEGYPGNLEVSLSYALVGSSLRIRHRARTDKPTVVNLTNHSYFRLDNGQSIEEHLLKLNSHLSLETHSNLLPTGNFSEVAGSSLDFQDEKPIGKTILDTPFVLNGGSKEIGSLHSKKSGIRMKVFTNQPGVVIFTPEAFAGICFETQNFPDAPNINSFPNSLLRPEETYLNETLFEFDLVP